MPKKMRRAALRSALSVKAADEGILLLDTLELKEAKTKAIAKVLDDVVGDASVLILIPEKSPEYMMVIRATKNMPKAKTLHASYLNVRDLLGYDKIVMPIAAIDVLETYLG